MINVQNEMNQNIDIEFLENIAKLLTDKDIDLLLTNNNKIRNINFKYRGVDKPTDVISFPFEDIPFAPLGQIIISLEYANESAKAYKNSLNEEVSLLFIHGLLHLLGYDHETDNGLMRKKEESIIKKFSLPDSLINRLKEE